jgi:hypothetical protein
MKQCDFRGIVTALEAPARTVRSISTGNIELVFERIVQGVDGKARHDLVCPCARRRRSGNPAVHTKRSSYCVFAAPGSGTCGGRWKRPAEGADQMPAPPRLA